MISKLRIFKFYSILRNSKVILEQYKQTTDLTIRIEGEITFKTLDEFKFALKKIDESKHAFRLNFVGQILSTI